MYGWAKQIQDDLSARLLPVARAAGAGIEVLVDLRHMTLRVVVPTGTATAVAHAVRTAILGTPDGTNLKANGWAVDVKPPFPRPYTSHVPWSGVARRPDRLRNLDGHVCVLVLARAEIAALQRALTLLEGRTANARVVATFGMGGLPLLHWMSTPTTGAASSAAAALATASRYHLLPGLNWSGTQREKSTFKTWLARELATPGEVLVFDTGTKGNGIRQARDLARKEIAACAPVAGASVAIAGLVDGPSHEPELYTERGSNGVEVTVTVDYMRVPHLPTEDNGLLLGYDVNRDSGVIHPVAGLILYRIEESTAFVECVVQALDRLDGRLTWLRDVVARCGRRLARHALVASSSGGGTIADLVRGHLQPAGKRARKADWEWATAAFVLANAQSAELEAVENAIAAGLVSPPVLNVIVARHEREQAQLLRWRWNRERKRVVMI